MVQLHGLAGAGNEAEDKDEITTMLGTLETFANDMCKAYIVRLIIFFIVFQIAW
jgi:hypothetical protein